jgi:hypothetical protein
VPALNILDFAPPAVPGEDVDVTVALSDALDAVPETNAFLPDRSEHAQAIVFPSLEGQAAYVLREPVDIPGNKNVRLAASSPFGARIELRIPASSGEANDSEPIPALRSCSGRRAHVFENLIFRGGGVVIGHKNLAVVGMTEFKSCLFTDIAHPDLAWAIKTCATGVVGVRILNCTFSQTDHGVGILNRACDNWIIGDNSRFVRMRGVGVEVRSSGVTIRDARFEDKLAGAVEQPYIRMRGDGGFDGGLSEITACRFGGEVGMDYFDKELELDGPPRHVIELGPNTETDTHDEPIVAVLITRNRFLGRTRSAKAAKAKTPGGPTANSAVHALALMAPVRHTVVAENHFRRYFGALVLEPDSSVDRGRSNSNLFFGNAAEEQVTPNGVAYQGVFSGGGASWKVWP